MHGKGPLRKLIKCALINPISDKRADFITHAALLLKRKNSGQYFIERSGKFTSIKREISNFRSIEFFDFSDYLALPGFVDMHFHWVQDDVCVAPKDNLLKWLSKYTWPVESQYKSKSFSQKKASAFANKLMRCGTMSGGCYSSLHEHTVDHAFKYFKGSFIVGNPLMTMNSPDYLNHTVEQAKKSFLSLSKKYKKSYALTPRFAPTTHPELMAWASKNIKKQNGFMQSHLCETKNEVDYVLELYHKIKGFEKVKSYTEIYKKVGMLGPKSIMGHGIYLNNDEYKMLRDSKTIIAHCPSSNAPVRKKGLGSGLFDFKLANKNNIRWALGTDIGAGPYLSMFDVMQSFIEQNKKNDATYVQALYRSTAHSAALLQQSHLLGQLKPNVLANFNLVHLAKKTLQECTSENVLKRLISPYKNKRESYNHLISHSFQNGHQVF